MLRHIIVALLTSKNEKILKDGGKKQPEVKKEKNKTKHKTHYLQKSNTNIRQWNI